MAKSQKKTTKKARLPLPVLIAAAECAPLAKAGGLADVVGALPGYLKAYGVDAKVILPYHRCVKDKYRTQVEHVCHFTVHLGWRQQYAGIEKLVTDDATYYLIDNEFYFGGPLYCGGEFEGEQYAFFTRAVLECLPLLSELEGFNPAIIHCNDWHTSSIPMLLKTQYQGRPQANLKTVFTIHNMAYQGQFSFEFMQDVLGFDSWLNTVEYAAHDWSFDQLKGGIIFADHVNTVSPTYAQEITTPAFGEGLEEVLKSHAYKLTGILNGLDYRIWDPAHDTALPATFKPGKLNGKQVCKEALLAELGLTAKDALQKPLVAMVTRLTPQKGIDLVADAIDRLMARDITMVILGSGYPSYESLLQQAQSRYPGRLCSFIGYNGPLSHRIYAASDLFLMPSAFEPCGISQLIAMKYGSLPIVHEVGGLRDTVQPYNCFTGEGTGFSFANYQIDEMLSCFDYALDTWQNPEARAGLIAHAMKADFGFDACAKAYSELYKNL
ncbi:MAG: glycogen synthase [Coriobacteriales bacterium]|nr:glycogen synthase [Coriobacteriales bacterium]